MAAVAVGKAAGAAYGHGESSGGSGGFLGPRVPAEVEAMARGLQEVGKETFRRLLKGTAQCGSPGSRSPPLGLLTQGRGFRSAAGTAGSRGGGGKQRYALLCAGLRCSAVPRCLPLRFGAMYSTVLCIPRESPIAVGAAQAHRPLAAAQGEGCGAARRPRAPGRWSSCARGHDPRGKVFVTALRL